MIIFTGKRFHYEESVFPLSYLKTTLYSDLFTASFCPRFKSMFRQERERRVNTILQTR